jgi:O-antigen ligase
MENLGLVGLVILLASVGRWGWRAWKVDIPKTPRVFQTLFLVGLICGAVSLYMGLDDPFAGWAVGLGLVFLYLASTGAQRVDGDMIEVGDKIPAFSAPDDDGNAFDVETLSGSRVLLKFFRGHW